MRIRGLHVDGDDVGVMVLLVADRGCDMPEQPERDLPFRGRGVRVLAEQGDPVLEVLFVAARSDEFKDGAAFLPVCH